MLRVALLRQVGWLDFQFSSVILNENLHSNGGKLVFMWVFRLAVQWDLVHLPVAALAVLRIVGEVIDYNESVHKGYFIFSALVIIVIGLNGIINCKALVLWFLIK